MNLPPTTPLILQSQVNQIARKEEVMKKKKEAVEVMKKKEAVEVMKKKEAVEVMKKKKEAVEVRRRNRDDSNRKVVSSPLSTSSVSSLVQPLGLPCLL
jgi:hypothetical protein